MFISRLFLLRKNRLYRYRLDIDYSHFLIVNEEQKANRLRIDNALTIMIKYTKDARS